HLERHRLHDLHHDRRRRVLEDDDRGQPELRDARRRLVHVVELQLRRSLLAPDRLSPQGLGFGGAILAAISSPCLMASGMPVPMYPLPPAWRPGCPETRARIRFIRARWPTFGCGLA